MLIGTISSLIIGAPYVGFDNVELKLGKLVYKPERDRVKILL